jgi:hypothetical protein
MSISPGCISVSVMREESIGGCIRSLQIFHAIPSILFSAAVELRMSIRSLVLVY